MSSIVTLPEIQAALPKHVTISSLLDSGGQGSVFMGTCNNNLSAIKIVNPITTEKKRIEREIKFLKATTHPNIVKLFDYQQITIRNTEFQLIAYEYIDQGDLSKALGRTPLPTASEIIKLATSIGNAINVLWGTQERLVHRDIKPKNIMVSSTGNYVLVDFGFARHIDLSDITIGGAPGTPGYASPEQALGRKHLTFKSDVFSLGVTLFVFASGKHPYSGHQPFPTTPVSEEIFKVRADLDPKLLNAILAMLKPSPVDRPADVAGLFAALRG